MSDTTQTMKAVLFADVVGSTRLYDTVGDKAAKAAVDQVLKSITGIAEEEGGTLVKYIGDELMTRFEDPNGACTAAIRMHEWTRDESVNTTGLRLKVGMAYGPVILDNNDVFGDVVNVAARLAGKSGDGQIIINDVLQAHLNETYAPMAFVYDQTSVRGKSKPMNIVMLEWDASDDATAFTAMVDDEQPVSEADLYLTVGGERYQVTSDRTFTIGRDQTCDLVLPDHPQASRKHATIEYNKGMFVLTDKSKNGTWVRLGDGDPIALKREDIRLRVAGSICLGSPFKCDPTLFIYYS